MRTTMQIKHKPIPICHGKNSYGLGENTLTDHRSQKWIDDRRFKGKHPACSKCSGCGKGNPCTIL